MCNPRWRYFNSALCAMLSLVSMAALADEDKRAKFALQPAGGVLVVEGSWAPSLPQPITGTESLSERHEITRRTQELQKVCTDDVKFYWRNGREFELLEYRDVPRSRQIINGTTITDQYTWAHVRSKSTPACEGWMEVNLSNAALFGTSARPAAPAAACLPQLSEKDCPPGHKGETDCSSGQKLLACTATGEQRVAEDWRCPISGAKPQADRRGRVFCTY